MASASALTSVAEALAALVAAVRPVPPRTLPLAEAVGAVLAEPLVVPEGVPPRAIAVRAGFAVAALDCVGASSYSPVLFSDQPAEVAAGEPLPPGLDAVLPPDAVVFTRHGVEIVAEAAPGENVRRAGEDAAAGDLLRPAGARLRERDAAAALAAGLRVAAVRQLTLRAVLPDTEAGAAAGCLVRSVAPACRPVAAVPAWTAAFAEPLPDLIIGVGGSGPELSGLLTDAGRVLVDGLALRSAEASLCGIIGRAPVLVLPPRWDAVLAATCCLVRPLIAHLTGAVPEPPMLRAPLTRKLSSSVGLTELALLRHTPDGLEPLGLGDLTLGALTQADAWLAVPPESEGHQAGERVDAYGF